MAVTNQFEGSLFVNPTFVENMTLAQYVAQLMPLFNGTQVQTVVDTYEKVIDGALNQAITIMTDCQYKST